ncbi:unnamed protein product [Parnassius apollo]|uniref:(apollo) hypothetical protein n=1 Tax=Parnassius apollo TaxID=110799 RepID=A0A8S3WI83_PARAO|nr:unnamed protein product [Parnassius apollo]
MASEEEPDSLKIYWDHFFKAETGTYEKSTWLDLFLAEFLVRLNDGVEPKHLIKFCPVSGVVTLVGCELLCGIHRVTSSINTHHVAPLASLDAYTDSETSLQTQPESQTSESGRLQPTSLFTRANAQSSTEILRKYLLGGVAWRCLALLRVLGVEGLSCCRQLSSVLIWLFGELGGGGSGGCGEARGTPQLRVQAPRVPIHQLFSHRIWSKQKSNQATKTMSAGSSERSSATGRARQNGIAKQDTSDNKARRRPAIDSEHSSESADSNDDLQILNRSMTIKVCSPDDDFEYFNSPVRSSNEYPSGTLYTDSLCTLRKIKPKADDYMSDKHRDIINTEITSFEFTLLITDLLQELCKAESSLTGSEGSQISMQCINFSLKNLCSLQFGSLPAQSNYNSEEVSSIKLALTELLIVSLDKVLIHSDLCAKLINNGILPMLLRILEDVICKSSSKYNTRGESAARTRDVEKPSETEAENLLKFVFGIAYSVTAFFHCLLMQCRTVDKLREFTDQFKLYGECLKGGLLKECIELMIRIPGLNQEASVILIKKLIESIGKLVSGMKRVRSEVIHTAACPRSRHKACRQRVAAGMHHHHDVLGEAGTGLPLPSACCISVLYGTLTTLVTDEEISAQIVLRNKILRVMLKCGVCCCFSPGFLMECIVRLMWTHSSVAPRCLQLLEHTVYGDLGASILIPRVTDQLPCSICEPSDDNRDLGRKYCPHGVSPMERKSVWSFLIHYNSLLQLDNHNNVLHATVSHLLKVTPKCRTEMKYELLFSVVYPTFIVSKHRYIIRQEESAYFLTVSCLNIFASLLNTVSFAEHFIQKGGLSYVLELVSLPEFSNQCCAILEIAIIVEIYKLMKENAELTYYREMSSLSSVQMLFKSLSEMTDKCYKIYKLKLPPEKFEELCDLTKEKEILATVIISNAETRARKISVPTRMTFACNENTVEKTGEEDMNTLKNICTFWKTCAGLCLYSPTFRQYVVSESVFLDSFALLKLVLHCLCECECGAAEARLLIKLMEALLTVQFAVSEVTRGGSREASCGVVRGALRAAAECGTTGSGGTGSGGIGSAGYSDGAGLRALCDALIGVAVARPSRRLAMPRLAPAKLRYFGTELFRRFLLASKINWLLLMPVPPLQCESGGSSADGSSSEDAAGPYASEHSEPHARNDDGYEADVEIGKLDASQAYKSQKLSDSISVLSSLSDNQFPMEALSLECTNQDKSGELAHPELCVIVVDILTQLIQKVMDAEEQGASGADVAERVEGGPEKLERVCCGLARALSVRLAGSAAPPALLRALLAPAARRLLRAAHARPTRTELQNSVLELIYVVASQNIEPRELAALLQLFTADSPPVGPLLNMLQKLVDNAQSCTPDFELSFPIQLEENAFEESKNLVEETAVRRKSTDVNTSQLQQAHQRNEGAGACGRWRCAARCRLQGAGWAPWLQGFAVVLWLQLLSDDKTQGTEEAEGDGEQARRRAAESDEQLDEQRDERFGERADSHKVSHVLSLGHDSLMFELWLHPATGGLYVRLSRGGVVLCSGRAACALPARRWACLALNVRELVLRRRLHVQVGCELWAVGTTVTARRRAMQRSRFVRAAGAAVGVPRAPRARAGAARPSARAGGLWAVGCGHYCHGAASCCAAVALRARCRRGAGRASRSTCANWCCAAVCTCRWVVSCGLWALLSRRGVVLCSGRAACALPARRWACLALNVRELVLRRRLHVQVGCGLWAVGTTVTARRRAMQRSRYVRAAGAALGVPRAQRARTGALRRRLHVQVGCGLWAVGTTVTARRRAVQRSRCVRAAGAALGVPRAQRARTGAAPPSARAGGLWAVGCGHYCHGAASCCAAVALRARCRRGAGRASRSTCANWCCAAVCTCRWVVGCGLWALLSRRGVVLCSGRAACALPARRWACLALNVRELVLRRRLHVQVGCGLWAVGTTVTARRRAVQRSCCVRAAGASLVVPRAQRARAGAAPPSARAGGLWAVGLGTTVTARRRAVLRSRCVHAAGAALGVSCAQRARYWLPVRCWACLALNVREQVLCRRLHMQVTFYLNGRECDTVSLPLQGILVRKATPTSLLLGHAVAGAAASWQLGSLRVLRAPVLTAHTALHLAAHGPDHACEVRCEEPNFAAIMTPEILEMNIDWDQVHELEAGALHALQAALLLQLAPHEPCAARLYPPPAPQQPSAPPAPPTAFGGRSSVGVPETLHVEWFGRARVHQRKGFAPALLLLGGPELLFYLFARVVELNGDASLQAGALRVALRAGRGDARVRAALLRPRTLRLLLPVLASPRCRVSAQLLQVCAARHTHIHTHSTRLILLFIITCSLVCEWVLRQVILEAACSSSPLVVSGGAVRLRARAHCALLEPRPLLLLLRAWPHLHDVPVSWEEEGASVGAGGGVQQGSVWGLALRCCCALLDGPHRAFNQQQANRAALLRHLLLACKERFLNSDSGPLGAAASSSLVQLARALLGSPPLLQHLALLADFLLLMHQASDTFVTHSRANFYFLLTAETPEASEFNILTFMNKRKNKEYKLKRDFESLTLNDATEDAADLSDSNLTPLKDLSASRDTENDRTDVESSTESTKEMKGIINQQIKESRTENGTAIQNKEAPEVSGAGGERGQSAESTEVPNGYVVVEEDELRHTTVELYTGGIYHQRRVRAGAEPGWTACAGLLLLLRDALAALPDPLLAEALRGALQAENLVVLANHRSASVRSAVVRCVCVLQRRAPHALLATPAAGHYYLHLADQISLYPGSWELATACAALLTKCDVSLEDQLDDDIWIDVGEDVAQRGAPLLALLPTCLHLVPLAHNVTLLLRRLVQKASLRALSEIALVEVVLRAIRDIGHMEDNFEGRELLLEDLHGLLNKVAIKALESNHGMQTVIEMEHQLQYVQQSARGAAAARVRREARAALRSLLLAQLDHLEARLASPHAHVQTHANYFANVLGAEAGWASGAGSVGARLGGAVTRALQLLLARSPRANLRDDEPLFRRLLATLLRGAGGDGSEGRARWWAGWSAECGARLQELFWWAGAPAPGARALQPALLRALYAASRAALAHLAPRDPAAMRKLAVYLLSMLQQVHAASEGGAPAVELAITDWARGWAVATQAELAERLPSAALPHEAERFLREDEERWRRPAVAHRQRTAIAKAVFGRETLALRATETAMAVTRRVVEAQNAERKAFLEHLRTAQAHHAAAAQRWQLLVDTYAHERGVWHSPRGWPAAWQLDSTEGPGRVRVRLRRAHLRLPARFLQPHARYKAEAALQPGPLRGVLGGVLGSGKGCARGGWWGGGLAARLAPGESVSFMARVVHVTVASETPGELLLSDRCIHFVPECSEEEGEGAGGGTGVIGGAEGCEAQSWALGSVARVCARRWCLQERAAELFLLSGHAHLLAFTDTPERDAFLHALNAAHLPNRTEPESLSEVMNQWRNGTITNWEYLMALNGLAGRSYNDLMQYPVFPFIIADYTSKILDLNDPTSFRDLSKPMAVQNKNREQHYINTYNDLKAARREGCSPLLSRQPHHYASLYSNSGGVLHYLVRVPPFTELFLNYQDNNFDMPDRTFHSMATTWRLITNDSPTDVKELIPELFYLPELFYNNEGLELGVRQCGARVDSVELAPWAVDARMFTLAHRQALEAPLVTERLPLWIDLVFGYKQTGQPAVDAINVFPACTYYGFDPTALEDEVDRTAAAAMVRTYGQAPRQLLRTPHPHVARDLLPRKQGEVMAGVSGLQWGRYCGSPALGPPAVSAQRQCGAVRVQPLPARRAAAACRERTALLPLPPPKEEGGAGGGSGGGAFGLVSWGHADGTLRLRRRRDTAPEPLLHVPAIDQITEVCTTCEVGAWAWTAFVGLASGRVLALRLGGAGSGADGGVGGSEVRQLVAHSAPVAALCACTPAALLVSADRAGRIVLWDLNRLTYIRTLPNRERLPVTHVAVSETLSDVATVHELRPRTRTSGDREDTDKDADADVEADADVDSDTYERDAIDKYQSLIRVHTVNGRFVGSVKVPEVVTCVCYSNAAEGASVNCVAAGLRSGEVRLYSSWELRPVRTLPPPLHAPPHAPPPLLSVAFSGDAQVLFACYSGGLLLAWEPEPHPRPAPRLVPAHALL